MVKKDVFAGLCAAEGYEYVATLAPRNKPGTYLTICYDRGSRAALLLVHDAGGVVRARAVAVPGPAGRLVAVGGESGASARIWVDVSRMDLHLEPFLGNCSGG